MTESYKSCKYCGETILAVAKKCKYCKSDLRTFASPQSPEEEKQKADKEQAELDQAKPLIYVIIFSYIITGLIGYMVISPKSFWGWCLFLVIWKVTGGLLWKGIGIILNTLNDE